MVTRLRIVMFGTPEFAVPTLRALVDSPHDVVAVVTQPDRPRGRGHKLTPSPVKAQALLSGLPVFQPERMRDEAFMAELTALQPDLGVVAAYGRILPQRLLDIPRLGMVNVHASLLPRWRGAAPVHRSVIAGDRETGITIMRVVLALDAGPMIARTVVPIDPNQTSAALEPQLAAAGAMLLASVVDQLAEGPIAEVAQDEAGVTYAHRLERDESDVDWHQPADVIHNLIRGLQPWPLVAARLRGERILLLSSELIDLEPATHAAGTIVEVTPDALTVAASPGRVLVRRLQPEGRAAMSVRDFLNSRHVIAGESFTRLSATS